MSITEIELIKSYVKEYFDNLDDRIKDYLEEPGTTNRSKTPNLTRKTDKAVKSDLIISSKKKANNFVKEYFQNVYKVWSAFTKSIRSVVVKNNEDLIVNT